MVCFLVSKWHFLSFLFPICPSSLSRSLQRRSMALTGRWSLYEYEQRTEGGGRLTRRRKGWDSREAYLTPDTVTRASGPPPPLDVCQASESSLFGHASGSPWSPGTSREVLEPIVLTVNQNGSIKVEGQEGADALGAHLLLGAEETSPQRGSLC